MSCANGDEIRLAVLDRHHGVFLGAPSLGRAPRVDDPTTRVPPELRHVAVSVGDEVAIREEVAEPNVPSVRRASVVNQADSQALELDGRPDRKRPAELPVVHVALHAGHRAEELQISEDRRGGEVAGVEDRVGCVEEPEALCRKGTRTAWKMRVSQERDQKRSGRNSPFR
jgi:hypothetical protein